MSRDANDDDVLQFLKSLEDGPALPSEAAAAGSATFSGMWGDDGWTPAEAIKRHKRQRYYKGASREDLGEHWDPPGHLSGVSSMDDDLLHRRAWDLYRNHAFGKAAVGAFVSNVICSGLWPEWEEYWLSLIHI